MIHPFCQHQSGERSLYVTQEEHPHPLFVDIVQQLRLEFDAPHSRRFGNA